MPASLVDIGVNLSNPVFQDDLEAVLERAAGAGVHRLVVTGTSVAASATALELCERFPRQLRATVGIHPHEAASCDAGAVTRLRELLQHPAACAVGETGLDFFRNFSSPEDQERAFDAQLALAAELGRPVFLHERDALARQLEILDRYRADLPGAVAHCFTGDRAALETYLERDCHIGITGWLCDRRRGAALRDAVARVPADRLMIESDAPYLLPRDCPDLPDLPVRRRNEPCTLPLVLQALAELRGDDATELGEQCRRNSEAFFGLDQPPAATKA
jgi:TatD DNase family protein